MKKAEVSKRYGSAGALSQTPRGDRTKKNATPGYRGKQVNIKPTVKGL